MANPAQFNVAPAPIQSPFTLDKNGVINSPAWLAWLTRNVFPVLTIANDAQTSIETLLELGKHAPASDANSTDLSLTPRAAPRENPAFPPPAPHAVPASGFPPQTAHARDIGAGLAILAAQQTGKQLPLWVIADTLANQGKYPNSSFPLYSLFVATDKKLVYCNTGAAWVQVPDVPASATVLASNADKQIVAAALPDADIWIGSGSNLPVAKAVSGDATLADTGALTLATVNASPGTYGDSTHVAQVTVNGKGLSTTVANVAIAFPAVTAADIIAALGYTPAQAGAIASGSADLITGAVTVTQV